MPELPEVETVVRTLRPRVLGARIRKVILARGDIVSPATIALQEVLAGRQITAIGRRGKKILIDLDDGNRFCIHLGMTGRLTAEQPSAPLLPHTHLVLGLGDAPADATGHDSATEVRFRDPRRFGGVWWLGCTDRGDGELGPEPLTLAPGRLLKLLSRTRRAIKTALLDQRLVAGLGNIYADEALHAAAIHPTTPANELPEPAVYRLNRAIKQVLNRALRHRGSTLRDYMDANGQSGEFQKLHRVYDRAGEPCARCGTRIERIVLGGRSTHFCPVCQAPGAAAVAGDSSLRRSSSTGKARKRLPQRT